MDETNTIARSNPNKPLSLISVPVFDAAAPAPSPHKPPVSSSPSPHKAPSTSKAKLTLLSMPGFDWLGVDPRGLDCPCALCRRIALFLKDTGCWRCVCLVFVFIPPFECASGLQSSVAF
jgi:hypothetical protein